MWWVTCTLHTLTRVDTAARKPFADAKQPVYVLAGVWFSASRLLEHAELFLARKKQHHVQMTDVKGSNLVKNAGGRRFLVALLNSLSDHAVPIALVLVHKDVFGAGVLIEDATDYAYNPQFDMSWTHPTAEKQDLMSWMAEHLANSMAAQYFNDRSSASAAVFEITARRCLSMLQLVPSRYLALLRKMEGADWPGIREMAETQNAVMGYSPNVTSFARFLEIADRMGETLSSPCQLVHDAQCEFAKRYQFWANACFNAGHRAEPLPYGMRMPTEWVHALDFEDSEISIGLQIADCVAAAARVVGAGGDDALSKATRRLIHECAHSLSPFVFGPDKWAERTRTLLGPRMRPLYFG